MAIEISKQRVATKVNELVANQGVFFVKLHQYHWYVKGPHFFTLHEKFEEYYNQTHDDNDAFAERLIAKGEKPYSTLSEFLKHSTIKEAPYTKKLSAETMVSDLVADYGTLKSIAYEGIEAASNSGDAVTEDMLIEYVDNIDINIWMLQAYIGKDATEGK